MGALRGVAISFQVFRAGSFQHYLLVQRESHPFKTRALCDLPFEQVPSSTE